MDFHQSASERFAEQIFKYIIKEFDGKTINSDDCNIEIMMKNLPENFDDFDLEDCLQEPAQLLNIDIKSGGTMNSDAEIFTDNIPSPKPKKEKKPKKQKETSSDSENNDKPERKKNPWIEFRKDPENHDSIIEKSNEINEETGKKNGKVMGAKLIWKSLTDDEQSKWK